MKPKNRTPLRNQRGLTFIVLAVASASLGLWVHRGRRLPSKVRSLAAVAAKPQRSGNETRLDRSVSSGIQRPVVRGLVRGSQGLLLEGATVCITYDAQSCCGSAQCASTDRTGHFAIGTDGSFAVTLIASAAGYETRRSTILNTALEHDLNLELEPGGTQLAGSVVDEQGEPINGAVVTAEAKGSDAALVAVVAGADGSFLLSVSRGPVELCARAEAYSTVCSEITAPSDGNRVSLLPESTIVGRVIMPDGEAVAGAVVTASNRTGLRTLPRTVRSLTDGTFAIRGLPAGGYDVVAAGERARSRTARIAIGVAETSDELILEAASATTLTASVFASGQPCADGDVQLSGPTFAREHLSADGTATIVGLLPGAYEATAACMQGLPRTVHLDIADQPVKHVWMLEGFSDFSTAAASKQETATATEHGGAIQVSIASADTRSIVEQVFAKSAEPIPLQARRSGRQFVFDDVPPGEYRIYVGDDIERARTVKIARAGELVQIQLAVAERVRIAGRVLDDDGQPVPDCWVRHFRTDIVGAEDTAEPPVLTDSNGAFGFMGAKDARYTVVAASSSGDGRVVGVRGGAEVAVRVSAPGVLSGVVRTEQGEPVPSFDLEYHRAGEEQWHVGPAFNSAFLLQGLHPGNYDLLVRSVQGSASRQVVVHPGDDMTVTLSLATAEDSKSPAWTSSAPVRPDINQEGKNHD